MLGWRRGCGADDGESGAGGEDYTEREVAAAAGGAGREVIYGGSAKRFAEMYSRADAVANIQSSMLLLALRSLTGQVGILGVALSGAGPSVLIFLDPRVPVARTRAGVDAFLKAEGLAAELLATTIATKGTVRGRG